MTYSIHALDPEVVSELLTVDDAGRAPQFLIDHEGGSPLRCCLKRSQPDEKIALVAYAPLRRWAREREVEPGAYDEVGPIFVHIERCSGPQAAGYPEELRDSRRMFRSYSRQGHIVGGMLVEANGPFEQVLDDLTSDPEIAVVHARAVEFGCFTFEVRRIDRRPRAAGVRHGMDRSGTG